MACEITKGFDEGIRRFYRETENQIKNFVLVIFS